MDKVLYRLRDCSVLFADDDSVFREETEKLLRYLFRDVHVAVSIALAPLFSPLLMNNGPTEQWPNRGIDTPAAPDDHPGRWTRPPMPGNPDFPGIFSMVVLPSGIRLPA